MNNDAQLSGEQKEYLQGFVAASELIRHMRGLPTFAATLNGSTSPSSSSPPPSTAMPTAESVHREAQDRFLADGKTLSKEEQAKRDKNPFEMWDEMQANQDAQQFPKGTDVFLYKFHGLFFVAPAQNAFMCRLRLPGGILSSHQFRGIADIARSWGGGYADVTTRANLQIREIPAGHGLDVLTSLHDLGILNRGSGADNIRNVTGSPTAGIDPAELIDTRPLTKAMHHYIIEHREMYGLPRKFNIAFDGGGRVSTVADTNDIGFFAVKIADGESVPEGVYFRLELGGITGHKDFSRDTGVLLEPKDCIPVAAAIVRVFNREGDRTDRKKARLKYVLDRMGFEGFLDAVEKELGGTLRRFPLDHCQVPAVEDRLGHVGVHPQRQPGLSYVGVVLPVGRLTAEQMIGLAKLADLYGSGTIRLTVWQNLLISDVPEEHLPAVKQGIEDLGLHWSATNFRAGLVACTGNAGCKYAASNTKADALEIARHLESKITIDHPINIHLTGCHHSCAQHYIGDIGLLATKVARGDDMAEGYHIYVGGGYGSHRQIGREIYRDVLADDVKHRLEGMIGGYLAHRRDEESFRDFTSRMEHDQLQMLFDSALETSGQR